MPPFPGEGEGPPPAKGELGGGTCRAGKGEAEGWVELSLTREQPERRPTGWRPLPCTGDHAGQGP